MTHLAKNQSVPNWNQLKFAGADGKYYFTDVLDIREIVYLIQTIPSPKARPFRLWLAELVVQNTNLETLMAEAGVKNAMEVEEYNQTSGEPYVLETHKRTRIVRKD